jgi:hypothetical protein
MTDILENLNEETKQKVENLATAKGWPKDLAAVAVLSGNEAATGVIDKSLSNATALSATEAEKAKAEQRAKLKTQLAEAQKAGDVQRSISLKSKLFDL